MSPSPGPMVGLSPNARLKPLLGMPMLSMMVSISGRNDVADLALDIGENYFGPLHAGSGRRARVQAHLAGIHRWEEVAADEHGQRQRPGHESPKQASTGPR
jgi:hypothetical protein